MTVVFKKIGVPSFFSNFMFEFANQCTFHVCLLPEHMSILMGFAKPAMPQGTSHDIYSVSAQIFFQKNALFGQFLASEASQNKEGWVPPTPLPHLKF